MFVVYSVACLFIFVHFSWAQPVLDTSTHNISLTAGNAAILTCQVRNLGTKHKVIWMGPSNTVLTYGRQRITTDDRFSVEQPYLSDWNLFIRHAKPRDAGTYTCKVTTNPPQTKKVNLNIKVAPTINHDLSSKSPQTVREGQNMTLTCVVAAEPPASVMWFYHNPNNPEAENQFPVSVTGESIVINSIQRDQAGIYTCQAFNGIPPVSKKNITVNVEFPPVVTTRTSKISQYRGRDTTIDCIIKAYPQDIAFWRKGNKEITEENMWKYVPTLYKRSDSEFVLNLQIISLEPGDFGLYTCEASNNYGTSTTSVLIEEIIITKPTTTSTTTPKSTTTMSITTTTQVTTTTSSQKSTTQKGVIIDENNNSSHVVEPPYTVLTTPAVKPPDGQDGDPSDGAVSKNYKWVTLTIGVLSVLVMI